MIAALPADAIPPLFRPSSALRSAPAAPSAAPESNIAALVAALDADGLTPLLRPPTSLKTVSTPLSSVAPTTAANISAPGASHTLPATMRTL